MTELNEYGIETAIDDFGTGFSSLERLEKLHFTTVKMDRILLKQLITKEKRLVVPEIINICKSLTLNLLPKALRPKNNITL